MLPAPCRNLTAALAAAVETQRARNQGAAAAAGPAGAAGGASGANGATLLGLSLEAARDSRHAPATLGALRRCTHTHTRANAPLPTCPPVSELK